MITPVEIKNQEFRKAFYGYNENDVDEFLDLIIESYEKIFDENNELKDKVLALTEKMEQFGSLEDTLKETLLVAQKTATEIVQTSKNKADVMINDAELESKKIIDKNIDRLNDMVNEYELLKKEIIIFKTRYRTFMEAQIASLEEFDKSFNMNLNDEGK